MIRETEKEIAKLTRNSRLEDIFKKYVEWYVKKKSMQPVYLLHEIVSKDALDKFAEKYEPNIKGTKFLHSHPLEMMFYVADFRITDFGNSVYSHVYLQPGQRNVNDISDFLKSNLDIEDKIKYHQSGKTFIVEPKLPLQTPVPKVTEENAYQILELLTKKDAPEPPISNLSYNNLQKLLDLNILKLRRSAVNFYHNLEAEEHDELLSVGFSILPHGKVIWDTRELAAKHPDIIKTFMRYAYEIFE